MEEVEWIYRRDAFDLTLGRAAKLLECADLLEITLLQKAMRGEWCGYFPPQQVMEIYPERVVAALDVLHLNAYREGQLVDEGYLRLLARIGAPPLGGSWDPSGGQRMQFWPQADWQATRRDLLHFYLLVKAEYVDLKARLQGQAVGDETLRQLAESASRLLEIEMATLPTIADFKDELIRWWYLVKWSPPEEGPPEPAPGSRRGTRWRSWLGRLFS